MRKIRFFLTLPLFVGAFFISCEENNEEVNSIPTIAIQPQDISVAVGDTDDANKLTVVANDADGDILAYQWQQKMDEEWVNVEAENRMDFIPEKSKIGSFEYRVLVSDAENELKSESAVVKVEGAFIIVQIIGNGYEVGNTLTVPSIRPGGSTNLTERPPLNTISYAPAFTMPADGESTEWMEFSTQDGYWEAENGVLYDLYLAIVIAEYDACYRQEFVFDNSSLPQKIVMDLRELTRVVL